MKIAFPRIHGASALVALSIALLLSAARDAGAQEQIVYEGDTWRYFKGTQEPPADWNSIEFNDSAWDEGPSGFGYGDGDDATLLDDMQNNYLSVYIRKTIDIPADSNVELTWHTFGGEHHELYLALLKERCVHDGHKLTDRVLSRQFRLHLHRGIGYLATPGAIRSVGDLVRQPKTGES